MMICVSPEVFRKLVKRTAERDQRRLSAIPCLERTERGDGALEPGVHGLQAKSRRPLEHHGEKAFPHQVLRDDELLDAVPVQVDGQGCGLDLVEASSGPSAS